MKKRDTSFDETVKSHCVTVRRTITQVTIVDVGGAPNYREARKIANKEARDFPERFNWTEA